MTSARDEHVCPFLDEEIGRSPGRLRIAWSAETPSGRPISDEDLAARVIELKEEGRLSIIHEEEESQEPQIICSLGLQTDRGNRQHGD